MGHGCFVSPFFKLPKVPTLSNLTAIQKLVISMFDHLICKTLKRRRVTFVRRRWLEGILSALTVWCRKDTIQHEYNKSAMESK